MPTLREIRLFCKRNQLVLFCGYVAVIYIVLNVFVAENNVSILRFQKSDNIYFDELTRENDVEDLRERKNVEAGRRSNKRNNFNDIHVKKDLANDNNDDGYGDDDDDDNLMIGLEDEDDFYDGGKDERHHNVKHDNEAGNLPKNKFHEERVDGENKYDKKKREMLRGKLERFKRLEEILREEKGEFGAYLDKVNNEKNEKKTNVKDGKSAGNIDKEDKDRKINKRDNENNNKDSNFIDIDKKDDENNDKSEKDKKVKENDKDDDKDKKRAAVNEVNKNDRIGGEDEDDDDDVKDTVKDNDDEISNKNNDKRDESKNKKVDGDEIKKLLSKETHVEKVDENETKHKKDKETHVEKVDENDTKHLKDKRVKDSKENKRPTSPEKKSNDSNLNIRKRNATHGVRGQDKSEKTEEGHNKDGGSHVTTLKANPVLNEVMAKLEKDKLEETFEVNLSLLNASIGDIKMPAFVEFGKEGDPGENSTRYEFPDGSLSQLQEKKRKEDYKKNYFDLWVSDKIAVHRSLNDPRPKRCRDKDYGITRYPPTTIIIVFHNEAWTTLLRSLHSIIDRTPKSALFEIVLVDDCSEDAHLKEPLEVYIKTLKLVRLVRAKTRLGLIKARNMGFLYAKGDIIVFLDSHIECFDGWLQPLVAPIVLDPKTVTFPIIDIIDNSHFGIQILPDNNVGTLRFETLTFSWEKSELKGLWYYRSPTMPGGLYAISRKWFHHLGAYDPGLKLWGGENLEISFKIWMCGGTLLASACSHVGHVFRKQSPIRGTSLSKAIKTNTYRLAEVWLDKYKHYYYERFNYKLDDFGDVTTQKALRKSLNCKSFDWYLSEINPKLNDQIEAGNNYSGLITNRGTGMCLQTEPRLLTVRRCDVTQLGQAWRLNPKGFLVSRDVELTVMEFSSRHRNTNVTTTLYTVKALYRNMSNVKKAHFAYDMESMHLVHNETKWCLDVEKSSSGAVRISPCHPKAMTQKWEMMTRQELQDFYRKKRKVPIDWSV